REQNQAVDPQRNAAEVLLDSGLGLTVRALTCGAPSAWRSRAVGVADVGAHHHRGAPCTVGAGRARGVVTAVGADYFGEFRGLFLGDATSLATAEEPGNSQCGDDADDLCGDERSPHQVRFDADGCGGTRGRPAPGEEVHRTGTEAYACREREAAHTQTLVD